MHDLSNRNETNVNRKQGKTEKSYPGVINAPLSYFMGKQLEAKP